MHFRLFNDFRCILFSRVFGQDQSPEDSDSDEEEENITSVEFLPGESTSVVLPPHQRCAAHTLNLVASKDSEAALQDGAFRTASRSLFAKAQAVWNKQSRVVSAAGNSFVYLQNCFTSPSPSHPPQSFLELILYVLSVCVCNVCLFIFFFYMSNREHSRGYGTADDHSKPNPLEFYV